MIMIGMPRRRRRGFGDYADWAASLGMENCGSATSVGDQYSCSLRNDAKFQAWAASPAQVAYQSQVAASEAASVAAYGGSPAQFLQQFEVNNPNVTPQTIAKVTAPLPPAPPPATVVNPSPPSQPTGTSTSGANPNAVGNAASGTTGSTGSTGNPFSSLFSTVEGYVSDVSDSELIPGVSNWILLGGAAVGLWMMSRGGGRAR